MPHNFKPEQLFQPELLGHVTELRNRLLICLGVWGLACVAGFSASSVLLQHLMRLLPGEHQAILVQLAPGEALMSSVKLSMWFATALAAPVILFHGLRFANPGLLPKEKHLLSAALCAGTLLFILGGCFGLYAVLPATLDWLLGFGSQLATVHLSIERFTDFCLSLIVLCGLAFELPLIILMLGLLGWVNSRQLILQWRSVLVGIVIAGAVLSPAQDPASMLMVSGALTVLFGVSLLALVIIKR